MSKEQPLKHHTRMTIKMSIFLKWCEKVVAPRHNMTWTRFKEATNAKSTADNMKGKGFADAKTSQMYSAKQYPATFRRIAESGLLSKSEVDFWSHVVFPAGFKKLADYEQMDLLPDTNEPDDTPCQPCHGYEMPDETNQQIKAVRHAAAEMACRLDDIDKARQDLSIECRRTRDAFQDWKKIHDIKDGERENQIDSITNDLAVLMRTLHEAFPMLQLPTKTFAR